MPRPVGHLTLDDVVIKPELKQQVNAILYPDKFTESEAMAARQEILRMAKDKASPYLFASEIRSYLEESVKSGEKQNAFPVAGDLFLNAMVNSLEAIGPNFFNDHYSGMIGCYRRGDELCKTAECPLYVVDLLLRKVSKEFLNRDTDGVPEKQIKLSFETAEGTDPVKKIAHFFETAERALKDTVDLLLQLKKNQLPPGLFDFLAEHKQAASAALEKWKQYHGRVMVKTCTNEDYLLDGLEVATASDYKPLLACVKEELGRHYRETDHDKSIHAYYDAGDFCHEQGNLERDSGAFNLSFRRYSRARRLFDSIRDRTAAAQALVERARACIKQGESDHQAHDDLYAAVSLVLAFKRGMPHGKLPTPTEDEVLQFLNTKGYAIEAEVYERTILR